jgi:cell division protein FtsN
MDKKPKVKISWLIWTFVVGLLSANFIIFIDQTMKLHVSPQAQATQQIEDEDNLHISTQQVFNEKIPSPEPLRPGREKDSLPVYTIQVGAFQSRSNAEVALNRLRERDYSAVKMSAVLKDEVTWYRVHIGEFRTKREAEGNLTQLQKDYADSFVIKMKRS